MPAARKIATLLALLGVWAASLPAAEPEPAVVVQVPGGRQFRGIIDGSSDQQQLVLRTELDGVTLRRPIRWERIDSATLAGQPASVSKLRELAGEAAAKTRESGISSPRSGVRTITLRGPPDQPPLPEVPAAAGPPPQVTSLSFDAAIANWDADVEVDG